MTMSTRFDQNNVIEVINLVSSEDDEEPYIADKRENVKRRFSKNERLHTVANYRLPLISQFQKTSGYRRKDDCGRSPKDSKLYTTFDSHNGDSHLSRTINLQSHRPGFNTNYSSVNQYLKSSRNGCIPLPSSKPLMPYSYVIVNVPDKVPDLNAVPKKSAMKKPKPIEDYTGIEHTTEIKDYPDGTDLPKNWVIYELGEIIADFRRLNVTNKLTKAEATARSKKCTDSAADLINLDFYSSDSTSYLKTARFAARKKKFLAKNPMIKLECGVEVVQPSRKTTKGTKRVKANDIGDYCYEGKRVCMSFDESDDTDDCFTDENDPDYEED